ncbi:hypothetical protein H2201_005936 [Coniosporium apollinis]|uniref:Uncharacterized protein n=1 Tax=Coniosporium apollinis TaxID=61459 RepID=A0ABQ9NNH0_9PEZI|nr:hypothetical protein H2201_005936 [Coniosporium apollinis]
MYYRATRAVTFDDLFGNVVGTTFNRDVYTKLENVPSGSYWTGTDQNFWTNFTYLVQSVLLHELGHVVQYRALGYSLPDFGASYLFGFCKSGFIYRNNPAELDAARYKHAVDSPLGEPGFQFYYLWAEERLKNKLGFPIPRQSTEKPDPNNPTGRIMQLEFQRGIMQIIPASGWRAFNGSEKTIYIQSTWRPLRRCPGPSRPEQMD